MAKIDSNWKNLKTSKIINLKLPLKREERIGPSSAKKFKFHDSFAFKTILTFKNTITYFSHNQ